ncbi:MAG: hypothetical protein IT580_08175 [Verrucomicrobiales bacterium]|nr:hypothetical protein [Verrucomicrobiales bacterium]
MHHPPNPTPRTPAARATVHLLLVALAIAPASGSAADLSLSLEPDALIPDADASGFASVLHVPDGGTISDLDVSLDLIGADHGAWNGDLFVLLSHAGSASVLVNRPGRTLTSVFGYGDNGFLDVTFDDSGELGDFHSYQDALGASGNSLTPISGRWEPDGRAIDPFLVTDLQPRTAFLDTFNGQDASGDWILFVADLSGGGRFRLEQWELHFSFDGNPQPVVPESTRGITLACALTAAGAGYRSWRRRRTVGHPGA